jgi:uncharacterized protein YndB with AHSA1/START domain
MTNALTLTAEPGLPFVDLTRDFDAPVAAVWRCFTDPELMASWLGPRELETLDFELDARTGGSWSYTSRNQHGEFRFRGVIHSLEQGKSITRTFEFEGVPGHVCLERADFQELPGGRTRLLMHNAFQSVEDRDGMVASGMEGGARESYERLDEILQASAPQP